jgi:hypothetical protein
MCDHEITFSFLFLLDTSSVSTKQVLVERIPESRWYGQFREA